LYCKGIKYFQKISNAVNAILVYNFKKSEKWLIKKLTTALLVRAKLMQYGKKEHPFGVKIPEFIERTNVVQKLSAMNMAIQVPGLAGKLTILSPFQPEERMT
jgi:hypothetical protein